MEREVSAKVIIKYEKYCVGCPNKQFKTDGIIWGDDTIEITAKCENACLCFQLNKILSDKKE